MEKANVCMDEKHTPDRLEASESIRKHEKTIKQSFEGFYKK